MTGERITGRGSEVAEAIAGKTIAKSALRNDTIAMRFSDGSWVYGDVLAHDMGDAEVAWDGRINPWDLGDLVEIGVMTRAEEAEAIAREADAFDAERERRELAEYERLRAKFEGRADA